MVVTGVLCRIDSSVRRCLQRLLSNNVIVISFALSLSKGGSWFDKLTTNGFSDFLSLQIRRLPGLRASLRRAAVAGLKPYSTRLPPSTYGVSIEIGVSKLEKYKMCAKFFGVARYQHPFMVSLYPFMVSLSNHEALCPPLDL